MHILNHEFSHNFSKKGCNFVTVWYNSLCERLQIVTKREELSTIFDDTLGWLKEIGAGIVSKVLSAHRLTKICCFLLVGIICVLIGLTSTGATLGYRLKIDGQTIATVKSKQQYTEALNIVKEKVSGIDVESVVSEPEYSPAVVLPADINNNEQVAVSIIETTDEIVSVVALKVNGETVAFAEDFGLSAALEAHKNSFMIEAVQCSCSFVDEITVENTFCLTDELSGEDEVRAIVSGLSVMTDATVVREVSVAHSTTYKKVSTRLRGNSATVKRGVNGTNRLTERVVNINGVESSRETLSTEVLSEPTTAVVEIGTAKSTASAAEKAAAYSSGFMFPLPSGVWTVTSYVGDGRGHQGMDLSAPYGTSIYAVKGGTVVASGWDGAYGYRVVISHGDGLYTKYAHASALCVSRGETVSAGDVIARVGSTGRSSGNHLHFEIRRGGEYGTVINPAPYIGLD